MKKLHSEFLYIGQKIEIVVSETERFPARIHYISEDHRIIVKRDFTIRIDGSKRDPIYHSMRDSSAPEETFTYNPTSNHYILSGSQTTHLALRKSI